MSLKSVLAAVVVLVMVGAVLLVPYDGVVADEGSADEYGYRWTDSNPGASTVSFDWMDISTTGTDTYVTGDDSYGGPLPIGFDFQFYGNTYSQFYVSTNGLVSFGSGSSTFSNYQIPYSSTPNNFVAPYWDDLCVDYVYNSGTVFYETTGVSPNRQLVVEFHEISRLSSYSLMTFEVILNETGEIWLQYLAMSGMTGDYASVGIENSDGSVGVEYSHDAASISDGLAVMFSLGEVGFGPAQDDYGEPGDAIDYPLIVSNHQAIPDTFDISNTSDLGWVIEVLDTLLAPLGDSNGDMLPDTGEVAPYGTFSLVVRVHIPLVPAERVETSVLLASSYADPANNASAVLTTSVMGAALTPPYDEYTPDDDSDSQYDFLGVNVTFDALFSDAYYLLVFIYDSGYSYIASTSASMTAGPGACVAYIEVPGETLFLSGMDGPYILDLSLYDGNSTLLSQDSHTSAAYLYTDFERPVVLFTPPHDDGGLDLNGDSFYDSLVVNVSVEVNEEGSYVFYAYLYSTFGSYIVGATNTTGVLTVGAQVVEMRLDGVTIRDSGINGPYEVYLYAYDLLGTYIGDDMHDTSAYTWNQFQPCIVIDPPLSDYGTDTDADTFFNLLVVEVPVDVSYDDYYTLYADLYDADGDYLDSVTYYDYLVEGAHTLVLEFDGLGIYDNGVDGQFDVELYLYSDDFGYMEYYAYLTSEYTYDEFERPPISLWPPYSDYAQDSDGDMLYDLLVVEVQVYVDAAGDYILDADLYDSGWTYVCPATNETYLDVGLQTILLEFNGYTIGGRGISDTFNVQLYVYDEFWNYYDSDGYTTSYYAAEDFETAVVFDPPHSDYGDDTNDNALYDWLVVEVVIDVQVAGSYYVSGALYAPFYICGDGTSVTLDIGTNFVELQFDGWSISDEMADGPYTVSLAVYDPSWAVMATDEYTTLDYTWDEFERASATFSPPYSDYALDVNADTLYDYLVVEVYVDVAVAGEYRLDAYLFTPSWANVANVDLSVEFDTGANTFELYFPGIQVWESGASGDFEVGFDFYDSEGSYLGTDWHTTSWYTWDEFSPPSGDLWPPHSDFGIDTDGDLLYNYLVVEVSVDVAIAGYFDVVADLYDGWGYMFASTSNRTYLETGAQTVDLYFAGWDIVDNGEDGPYDVWLVLNDFAGVELDSGWYTTGYYAYDEFQTSPARLSPPYSDYGLDTGTDLLYDYLVFEVPVEVALEADYTVAVDVYDSDWSWICYAETDTHLAAGTHTVEVMADGWALSASGADGPYEAEIYLYDWFGNPMDFDYYTTGAYSSGDFQTSPGVLEAPHSDHCIDSDGDSLYDYLVVDVNLDIAVGGTFIVYGELYDGWGGGIDVTLVEVYLAVGAQTISLSFEGWRIYASGDTGPYYAEIYLYSDDEVLLDYGEHATDAYPRVDFEPDVPSLRSYWTDSSPTIDGVLSEDEWADAVPVDLILADPDNALDTIILVMNNGTHLFICYDVVGDLSEGDSDAVSVAFDTGNDGLLTDGAEDQFVVGGTDWVADGQAHYVYSSAFAEWVVDCTPFDDLLLDHAGLSGSMGFGASDNQPSDHRIFEICIPLDLLGATAGDVLGFLAGSQECPGALDGDAEFTYSTWPSYLMEAPELAFYGDLVLYSSSPPVTEVSLNGTLGDNGWFLSAVVANLSAEDADEGVDYTMYRLDGVEWLVYSGPITVTGGRVHTLEYYSVDLGGNAEETQIRTISIDLTVPSTTAVVSGTEGENDWYTSAVSVSLSASDTSGGSGVNYTMYRVDGGTWTEYAGTSLSFSESGSWVIEFYSVDMSSRVESTKSFEVMVDLEVPVTTAVDADSIVTLTATDGISGVDATYYRIDGGDWIVYSGAFTLEGSGNHSVEYYSVDVAGNTEAVRTLYVDLPAAGVLGQIGELWLVLLIIGLMAAIAIPVIFGMRRKAKMADSRAVIKDSVSSVSQMMDEPSTWPSDARPGDAPKTEGEDLPPPPK